MEEGRHPDTERRQPAVRLALRLVTLCRAADRCVGRYDNSTSADTTEFGPQGDDEIGRTSLHDAEGKVRHPSALDHPRALQIDRPSAEVVEQSDAAPEQDGHQVDVDFVEESRPDALLHDARGPHPDVL